MQKTLAAVVEYVFAMIRGIYKRRIAVFAFNPSYNGVEQAVGIGNGVVVGVDEFAAVVFVCVRGIVGFED